MSKLNARFSAAHEYFGGIKVGRDAPDTYEYWRAEGKSHDEAEILASNVLQRAGYNVNARGGISIDTDEAPEQEEEIEHAHVHLRVPAVTKALWVRQSREEGRGRHQASGSSRASQPPEHEGSSARAHGPAGHQGAGEQVTEGGLSSAQPKE